MVPDFSTLLFHSSFSHEFLYFSSKFWPCKWLKVMQMFCHYNVLYLFLQRSSCTNVYICSFWIFNIWRCSQPDVFVFQVKIAIIGITAGGVGLDFSSAQNVVFLELPQSPSLMLQVWQVTSISFAILLEIKIEG